MDFTKTIPPSQGKTKISMGREHLIYKGTEDEQRGEIRLVRHWHAIGRKVSAAYHSFYIAPLTLSQEAGGLCALY